MLSLQDAPAARKTRTPTPAALHAALLRAQDNVIDLDLVVDDCRRDVDGALGALRTAVRERERAVVHLAQLTEWARAAG